MLINNNPNRRQTMLAKTKALNKIKSLVRRFDEQKESYRNTSYNEAQTKQDFINPFWEALGWDVGNKNERTESSREVIQEARIKVGETTKAPDYSFRMDGKLQFFLE